MPEWSRTMPMRGKQPILCTTFEPAPPSLSFRCGKERDGGARQKKEKRFILLTKRFPVPRHIVGNLQDVLPRRLQVGFAAVPFFGSPKRLAGGPMKKCHPERSEGSPTSENLRLRLRMTVGERCAETCRAALAVMRERKSIYNVAQGLPKRGNRVTGQFRRE